MLGPAEDGGYGLIGLRARNEAIFKGVEWGSEFVTNQTLDIANKQGLQVGLLEEVWDVDCEQDWLRYLARDS